MDLNYVIDNDSNMEKALANQGYDLESLFLLCTDMITLSNDLNLETGDLRDMIFRMKNRFDYTNGKSSDIKLRCEDQSPSRITFQPHGQGIYYFSRLPGQENVTYKECAFYCEACGQDKTFYKPEIKAHVLKSHRFS